MIRIKTVTMGISAALLVGLSGSYARAGDQPATGSNLESTNTEAAMMGPEDMMARCMGMMKKMDMSEMMMKRMDAMMKTPIFLDSPCAVYGQKDRLDLTEEQQQQLIRIENDAREKSLAVLTAEQKKTLGELPDKPMAMMKMCRKMGGKMMPMMGNMQGCMGPEMMGKSPPESDAPDSGIKPPE